MLAKEITACRFLDFSYDFLFQQERLSERIYSFRYHLKRHCILNRVNESTALKPQIEMFKTASYPMTNLLLSLWKLTTSIVPRYRCEILRAITLHITDNVT